MSKNSAADRPGAAGRYRMDVLVEDRSGAVIVAGLLERALREVAQAGRIWEVRMRPHRGVGTLPDDLKTRPEPLTANLLGLLPAKLRAYSKVMPPQGPDLVLVVCDADNHDPRRLFNGIRHACLFASPALPVVIGLAVEELEAWMLADREALQTAFPHINMDIIDAYEQDSVCGTWEILARALLGSRAESLIEAGYPAVGMYKSQWANRIAPHLDPKRNQSPSFQRFYKALCTNLNAPPDRERLLYIAQQAEAERRRKDAERRAVDENYRKKHRKKQNKRTTR